jgi:putative DNA primase/helicase
MSVSLKELALAKSLSVDFLVSCGLQQDGDAIMIGYRNSDGSPARTRCRYALQAKKGTSWAIEDRPIVPYGLWRPTNAKLLIVEGETDCLVAWNADIPCLGIPGGQNSVCLKAEHLINVESIVVIEERDQAGKRFPSAFAARLGLLGWKGRLRRLKLPQKDLADYWLTFENDTIAFRKALFTLVESDAETVHVPGQSAATSSTPIVLSFSNVTAAEASWLWYPYIPRSEITWFEGPSGLGKTMTLLEAAARMSRGDAPPAGDFFGERTLILTADDDPEITLKPRLMAVNANMDNILVLKGAKDGDITRGIALPEDCGVLEIAIRDNSIDLVVIDGAFGFLNLKDGASKDYGSGYTLMPQLVSVARRTGVGFVMVRHTGKDSSKIAANLRGIGSVAFAATARSIVAFGKIEDDDNSARLLMAHTRCNVGPEGKTLEYRLVSRTIPGFLRDVGALEWIGAVSESAEEAMHQRDPEETSEIGRTKVFLRDFLGDGPRLAKEVEAEAKRLQIHNRTLYRASKAMGIEKKKVGGFQTMAQWELPTLDKTRQPEDSVSSLEVAPIFTPHSPITQNLSSLSSLGPPDLTKTSTLDKTRQDMTREDDPPARAREANADLTASKPKTHSNGPSNGLASVSRENEAEALLEYAVKRCAGDPDLLMEYDGKGINEA